MKLYELKEKLEKLQAEGVDSEYELYVKRGFKDFMSDIDYYITLEDEDAPGKSDFEEHNTLNHAQQGITR